MKLSKTLILAIVMLLALIALCSCGKCRHENTKWRVIYEPTCYSSGKEGTICEDCGEILESSIINPSHMYEKIPAVEPTCTEEGYTEGLKCGRCGEIFDEREYLPIIPHTYDDVYDEECNECGFIRDAECAHAETEIIKGYAATCTNGGYTDGEKCKKCEEFIVWQEYISPLGHTEMLAVEGNRVEATCTVDGSYDEVVYCSVCDGEVSRYKKTIKAPGHSFSDWTESKAPTCISKGEKLRACNCGTTEAREINSNSEAHNWNEENTCTYCAEYKDKGVMFTFDSFSSTYDVSDYTGKADAVIIPSTYKGFPVTHIGDHAFSGCYNLTSIEIPSSVTSIGNSAFRDCTSLTSIVIPDSVTWTGSSAFDHCTNLKDVYYTGSAEGWCNISFNSYSSNPMYYGDNLYFDGELVTEIVIPDTVTKIKDYAFSGCTSLTSIVIPDSVTSIGEGAFYSCDSFTSVVIGDSVTSIGDYAFLGCNSLTSVFIPDSVTSIGYAAFSSCTSLTSVVIPDSVTSIGDYAFFDCDSLTSVVIPDSVTSIGKSAFEYCRSLTSIVIPDSVTSIGNSAFYGCKKLVEVINKSSLDIVAGSLSYGYVACYAIEVHSGESKIVNQNDYLFYTYNGVNYLFGYVGSDTELVLPASYNGANYEIYQYAFYENKKITSIEIPDSVTSIDNFAFSNCTSLTSVVIPDSVTSIGFSAFSGCSSLTIYCEAESQPDGWGSYWNYDNRPVVWGYKG